MARPSLPLASGREPRHGSQVNDDFGLTRRCDSLLARITWGRRMDKTSDFLADEDLPKARVALLLKHFSRLDDERQPWRIVYPLSEVLLLLTCATIASCDDFDEIAAWGKYHLDLLRKFAPYHNGIPCERWLRTLVNRIDPQTFASCFEDSIHALWPGRHILIAIDGKTSRRTHDKRKGLKALHTLSAYATNAHLTLAQISVPEKTNEITAIPVLLDHLAEKDQLEGALVTIDAMGCQVDIAAKIVEHKADFLLPLKGNQPTLEAEVEPTSKPRRRRNWSPRPRSRRATAASRPASLPPRKSSTGSRATNPIRVNHASKTSLRFFRYSIEPNTLTDPHATPESTSPPRRSTSNGSPPDRAAIGASRACTGCSTWSSRTTSRDTAPATAPRTWPSFAASRSASCAPTNPKGASKPAGNQRAGIPSSSSKSCR